MSLPAFAKEHSRRLSELESRLALLESAIEAMQQKLLALGERKKPGPKPKEPA